MRRPRNAAARGRPSREPYDRVLIVCEGTKTEPNYFSDLARHYELSTANIEIVGSGADPLTIVKKGKERQQKERKTGKDTIERIASLIVINMPTFSKRAFWRRAVIYG